MPDLNAPMPDRGQVQPPNCWQCHHFAISWDPSLPYSCRLMGFKTRVQPALEVLRVDGERCRGFAPKVTSPADAAHSAPMRRVTNGPRQRVWEA